MLDFLIILSIGAIAVVWYLYRQRQEREDRQLSAQFRAKLKEGREAAMHDPRSSERRPRDWSLRRDYVFTRDGRRCTRCGATDNLHVHHVVPVSKRVDHSVSNLTTLCVHCHAEQDGHGLRVVESTRASKATRLRYDARTARANYTCSRCGAALPRGSKTYVKRSDKVDGHWINRDVRICSSCMLSGIG